MDHTDSAMNIYSNVDMWSKLCLKMREEDIITGNVKYIEDDLQSVEILLKPTVNSDLVYMTS